MRKISHDPDAAELAQLSEELATPLNAILHLALRWLRAPAALTVEQAQELQAVQANARQLLAQINTLTEVARYEAGATALELRAVDAPEVLDEVLTALAPVASTRGCELQRAGPVGELLVRADRQVLYRTLIGLLGHVLHAHHRATVLIVARRRRGRGEDSVSVRIHCEHLMSQGPSERASPALNRAGIGLGWDGCRRLARLLGGRIRVRRAVGAGATFTLTLTAWEGSAD